MDIVTLIIGFVMVESIITPIIVAVGSVISLYMAKKFGGVYRQFFILFAIGWLFQLLHSIDETLLVITVGTNMPPGPPPTIPQFLSMAPIFSPIFQGISVNLDFFSVKMIFMVISAFAIVLGLFIYNRLIEKR